MKNNKKNEGNPEKSCFQAQKVMGVLREAITILSLMSSMFFLVYFVFYRVRVSLLYFVCSIRNVLIQIQGSVNGAGCTVQ